MRKILAFICLVVIFSTFLSACQIDSEKVLEELSNFVNSSSKAETVSNDLSSENKNSVAISSESETSFSTTSSSALEPSVEQTFPFDCFFNPSSYETDSSTSFIENGIYSVNYGLTIDSSLKKSSDGLIFLNRLKLGGKSVVSTFTKCIKVTPKTEGTFNIYALSGSSADPYRFISIFDENGNKVSSTKEGAQTSSSAIKPVKLSVPTGGTYYIGSTDGAINIYFIVFSQNESDFKISSKVVDLINEISLIGEIAFENFLQKDQIVKDLQSKYNALSNVEKCFVSNHETLIRSASLILSMKINEETLMRKIDLFLSYIDGLENYQYRKNYYSKIARAYSIYDEFQDYYREYFLAEKQILDESFARLESEVPTDVKSTFDKIELIGKITPYNYLEKEVLVSEIEKEIESYSLTQADSILNIDKLIDARISIDGYKEKNIIKYDFNLDSDKQKWCLNDNGNFNCYYTYSNNSVFVSTPNDGAQKTVYVECSDEFENVSSIYLKTTVSDVVNVQVGLEVYNNNEWESLGYFSNIKRTNNCLIQDGRQTDIFFGRGDGSVFSGKIRFIIVFPSYRDNYVNLSEIAVCCAKQS